MNHKKSTSGFTLLPLGMFLMVTKLLAPDKIVLKKSTIKKFLISKILFSNPMPNKKEQTDTISDSLGELSAAVEKLVHCLQRTHFQEKQIAHLNKRLSQRIIESEENISYRLASIKKELKIEFLDSRRPF